MIYHVSLSQRSGINVTLVSDQHLRVKLKCLVYFSDLNLDKPLELATYTGKYPYKGEMGV